ncbi:MAG: hypothetical protein M1274_06550 [Actinobacteria bacterium]|nr:hypothetical protein [Actinomycetota bacterium]
MIVAGVVIGMGITFIANLPVGLVVGMIVLALICVAAGLGLNRKFAPKDDV